MSPPSAGRSHNGAAILDRLVAILTRYVILPSAEAADAVALWIAASHAQPAWAHAPRLVIRAPEKRCGKSRLLDIIEGCCHAPLITVNASPAAVYRAIGDGDGPPTLLVDEADTIFGGKNADANEDLRGLLNAGHQRTLHPGEQYVVDTGHVVAWHAQMPYKVRKVTKSLFRSFTSGEVLVAEFTGPGTLLMQTRNLAAFAGAIVPYLPQTHDAAA